MQDLVNYINQNRSVGVTDIETINALLGAGHSQTSIDEALCVASVPSVPAYNLYSQNAIYTGAFFGTILCAIYMMYKNYRAVKRFNQAKIVLVVGGFSFIVFFLLALNFDPGSVSLFTAILVALMSGILQKDITDHHKKYGGKFYSVSHVVAIIFASIIAAIVSVIIIIFTVGFIAITLNPALMQDATSEPKLEIVNSTGSLVEEESGTVVTSDWSNYENTSLGISFSYPKHYGQIYEDTSLGAPANSGHEHEKCREGSEFESSIACTGLIIGFSDVKGLRKSFLVVHGTYMKISPQGGWWGFSSFDDDNKNLKTYSKNPNVMGEPNTKYFTTEMGGDFNVQYIVPDKKSDLVSHIVIASPLEIVTFPKFIQDEFNNRIELHPYPVLADYPTVEAWQDAFSQYYNNVAVDVSKNEHVMEYIMIINSIAREKISNWVTYENEWFMLSHPNDCKIKDFSATYPESYYPVSSTLSSVGICDVVNDSIGGIRVTTDSIEDVLAQQIQFTKDNPNKTLVSTSKTTFGDYVAENIKFRNETSKLEMGTVTI